jgi:hypothetical protein
MPRTASVSVGPCSFCPAEPVDGARIDGIRFFTRSRFTGTTAARLRSRTAKDGEKFDSEWLNEHAWKLL